MLDDKVRRAILSARDAAAEEGIVATFSLHQEQSHLMRIGNSSVSLNTSENLTRLDVEVTEGSRQGSQTHLGKVTGEDVVRAALDTAVTKAKMSAPKDYVPRPDVVEQSVDEGNQHDPALADLDPAVKAESYARIIEQVGNQYDYSGSWSSGVMEQYVATTANRNEAYHIGTDQQFGVVLKHPEKRWELRHDQTGWRQSDFDSARSVESFKALLPTYESMDGHQAEPGSYTVMFGAEALAEIVAMASWTGLSGRGWEEKMGWTSNNDVGDKILGDNITLVDDPSVDDTFGMGFDMSGKRRTAFPLVSTGALAGLMYDSNTAAKYGREATGHHSNSWSVVMATGSGPADRLAAVQNHERVLYIPALHYVHIPNPSQGMFTGSSRFSAVVIEHGEVTQPLFSSRVTDTFQNVLGNVSVLSGVAESVNKSNTYGRRAPIAMSVPSYAVIEGVRISDSAEAF